MERNLTKRKHLHVDIINKILKVLPSKSLTRFTSACKTWYYLIKYLEIILRVLPTKSLVRFSSACKTWYDLIKSHQFITSHINFNRFDGRDQHIFVLGTHVCYIIANKIVTETIHLDFTVDYMFIHHTAIGSCNGVVLVPIAINYDDKEYLLYNPSIKKSKKFDPRAYKLVYEGDDWVNHDILGLGFHESFKDHRVVRIFYSIDKRTCGVAPTPSIEVDVYSLITDSWHKIDSTPGRLIVCSPGAFVNGAIHWLATTRLTRLGSSPEEDHLESLLLFDFVNETFKEMALPEHLHCSLNDMHAFYEFKGSVAVCIGHTTRAATDEEHDVTVTDLWVMTEYGVTESWTKKFTIKSEIEVVERWPMGLLNGGILVYMERPENEKPILVFHDVDNGQRWHIDFLMDASNFMEFKDSLFLFSD